MTDFEVGDRVRLNEAGKTASPRMKVQTGTIMVIPEAGGKSVQVLFDGNKKTTRIHRSYIEIDPTA